MNYKSEQTQGSVSHFDVSGSVEEDSEPPFIVDMYVYPKSLANLSRASALMERIPSLVRIRAKLVPSRLSEREFWTRFFAIVRDAVLVTLRNS